MALLGNVRGCPDTRSHGSRVWPLPFCAWVRMVVSVTGMLLASSPIGHPPPFPNRVIDCVRQPDPYGICDLSSFWSVTRSILTFGSVSIYIIYTCYAHESTA